MFFLFGFGKQTIKKMGKIKEHVCSHCHKPSQCILVKVVDWFTIFFIPIFPYLTRYALTCPLCDNARELSREELTEIATELMPLDAADSVDPDHTGEHEDDSDEWFFGGDSEKKSLFNTTNKYEGKTPTQIAYLSKLEAREKEIEAREGKSVQDDAEAGKAQEEPAAAEVTEAGEAPSRHVAQEADEARKTHKPHTADEANIADEIHAGHKDKAGKEEEAAKTADTESRLAGTVPSVPGAPGKQEGAGTLASNAREKALEAREKALAAREMALAAREKAVDVREKALDVREASRR
ncbi:MAG: zinc-ribbon domain-containing protein [Clostridiales bacterium]|nr:zinc-ribbon domain-containing protein [Clostridiales bacterium]